MSHTRQVVFVQTGDNGEVTAQSKSLSSAFEMQLLYCCHRDHTPPPPHPPQQVLQRQIRSQFEQQINWKCVTPGKITSEGTGPSGGQELKEHKQRVHVL